MTANVMGSSRRIGSIAGTDTELVPGTAEIRNKLMAATTLGERSCCDDGLGGKLC